MRIESSYHPDQCIASLKENMGDRLAFRQERFTGFFFGRCFTITHHSEFVWNRRITNEKNTAVGFVKAHPEGCEICFLHVRGILAPAQFLLYYLLITGIYLILPFLNGALELKVVPVTLLVSLGITAFLAVITAIAESFTQQSEAGRRTLLSLLMDPDNPYEYFNKV